MATVQIMTGIAAPDGHADQELVYDRVAADIRSQIQSGVLKSGTRLLAERALAEHYECSYGSIRKAMELLRDEGLIRSIHGRGTFVA